MAGRCTVHNIKCLCHTNFGLKKSTKIFAVKLKLAHTYSPHVSPILCQLPSEVRLWHCQAVVQRFWYRRQTLRGYTGRCPTQRVRT